MKKKAKKKATKKKATKATHKKAPRAGRTKKVPGSRLTKSQKGFVEAFEEIGKRDVTVTAAAVGIHKSTHYRWMEKSTAYAEAFDTMLARADASIKDQVRAVAMSRALDGWVEQHEEQIIEQREVVKLDGEGNKVVELVPTLTKVTKRKVHKFSDGLLQRLLNDYWGDVRRIDISAPAGTNGQLQITLEVARQIVGQGQEAKKK